MGALPPHVLTPLRELQLYSGVSLVGLSLMLSSGMDDDKIEEVAKIWKQAARNLDDPADLLERIPTESSYGWIADDQREFARATGDMHASTKALRDSLDKLGDILDSVVFAHRLFKGAMVAFIATLVPIIGYLVAMSLMPASAVQGKLMLRWLANAADKVMVVMTSALITYVTGQTAVFAYLVSQQKELGKMGEYTKNLDGVIGAKLEDVDFAHVKIDAWAFPTFQPPDPGEKLPYRTKDFDWVAPYDPPTEPPAEPDQD